MKFTLCILILFASPLILTAADETVKENVHESVKDSKRAMRQANRELEDKTCELVNGKMVCALKKIKHSAEKSVDKVQDAED